MDEQKAVWLFEEYNRAIHLAERGQNQEAVSILRSLAPDFEETYRLTGQPDLLMTCLASLASLTSRLPDLEIAIEDTQRVIEFAISVHDDRREQMFSQNLVKLYLFQCEQALRTQDLDRAMEIYKLTLNLASRIGDHRDEGRCLGNIATIYSLKGDPKLAIEFHKKALAMFRTHGFMESYAIEHCNMGNAYLKLGQFQEAHDIYRDTIENCDKVSEQTWFSCAMGIAICSHQLGNWSTAREHYRLVLDAARNNRTSAEVEFFESCLKKVDQRQKLDFDDLAALGFT